MAAPSRSPRTPISAEGLHFAGCAQRDSDVFVERRIFGANENVVLFEVLDNFVGRAHRIHHHEIGLRIDGSKHARVNLVHELLAVVSVSLYAEPHVVDVIERGRGGARGDYADTPAGEAGGEALGDFRSRNGIADAHSGKAIYLRERA